MGRVTPRTEESHRVVVADDNPDFAASLALMLRIMGCEVDIAYNGEQALRLAGEKRAHVVVLDIGMPKLTGYDAARAIREQPWGREAVLVAVSGWGEEEDRRTALEAGFDHHLTKPVNPAFFEALLSRIAPR
jgi:CheY-like chemotaxis protein